MYQSLVEGREVPWSLLVKDVPEDKHNDLDFIIDQLDWEKNVDTHFKDHNYLEPIVADSGDGWVDKWIVYGQVDGAQLFSARELTLEPGAKCTLNDPGASGWITTQGKGRIGKSGPANAGHDSLRRRNRRRGIHLARGGQCGRRSRKHRYRAAGQPALFRPEYVCHACPTWAITRSRRDFRAVMNSISTPASQFVLLYGVPWRMYQGILNALGEYHLRHTYIEGTLEMPALLYAVTWQDYQAFLDALGDYSLRHTYDRGTLEMMSPRKDHDWVKRLLGRMVEQIAYELNIPIQSVGSTTLTGDSVERGLQPDEAYYIAHEAQVRFKKDYDPSVDPPPDLVIEVDVTSSSLDRLPTFAAVGVPEIWRHDDNKVIFYQLQNCREYIEIERSVAFPFLTREVLTHFLDQYGTLDENSLVRSFMDWVKENADSV